MEDSNRQGFRGSASATGHQGTRPARSGPTTAREIGGPLSSHPVQPVNVLYPAEEEDIADIIYSVDDIYPWHQQAESGHDHDSGNTRIPVDSRRFPLSHLLENFQAARTIQASRVSASCDSDQQRSQREVCGEVDHALDDCGDGDSDDSDLTVTAASYAADRTRSKATELQPSDEVLLPSGYLTSTPIPLDNPETAAAFRSKIKTVPRTPRLLFSKRRTSIVKVLRSPTSASPSFLALKYKITTIIKLANSGSRHIHSHHYHRYELGIGSKMAPDHSIKDGVPRPDPHVSSSTTFAGPPLGSLKVSRQYYHELQIRRKLANMYSDPAREIQHRIQGVQLIEMLRSALHLPINTFAAACTFYHRFRLKHRGAEYGWNDVAMACLFFACKTEDTLKKSREILCANYNIKNPDHPTTQDDKIFDQPSKMLIGLERHIVEAVRFDVRIRYPQKMLIKIVKDTIGNRPQSKEFFLVAYTMSVDLFMTFAPLKYTTATCAFVLAQLTAMVTGQYQREFQALEPKKWKTEVGWVAEVTLDLLDLYTDHHRSTKLGQDFDLQLFIDIKIRANKDIEAAGITRYVNFCAECDRELLPPSPSTGSPGSPISNSGTNNTTKRGLKGHEGTTRFIFDENEARREQELYRGYSKDQWEEVEEEVEETMPDPNEEHSHDPRGPRAHEQPRGPRGHRAHGQGRGGHGPGRGGFDAGWHPRNRNDRRRRGGGGGGGGGGYY